MYNLITWVVGLRVGVGLEGALQGRGAELDAVGRGKVLTAAVEHRVVRA